MQVDYYQVLRVRKGATSAEICDSFRKLALQHHPDRNREDTSAQFRQVCEAFHVLSDRERRAVFDQYGRDGLLAGVPGMYPGGYEMPGAGDEVFHEFFGTDNPFADIKFDKFRVLRERAVPPPAEIPVTRKPLRCTLAELFNGAIRRLEDHEGALRDVRILPGWRAGTQLHFPNGAEERKAASHAVTYEVEEAEDAVFQRVGDDLVHTAKVSLADALTDCVVSIPTLDGRTLRVGCPEVISPGYRKRVEGEGMPRTDDPTQRGDLIVAFQIEFPRHISLEKKAALRKLLA